MNTRLILIEGIPGSGKSTVAGFAEQILKEMNVGVELFSEGNLDHPADYEGVACLSWEEYESLFTEYSFIENYTQKQNDDYLVSYRKIQSEKDDSFVDQLVTNLGKKDIYELPLTQHMDLIVAKWEDFIRNAMNNDKTYVFDCSFLQNPVTMSFVKNNAPREKIIEYIKTLEKIIKPLNPILIYVDQDDLGVSFKKAVAERPSEWFNSFIDYYTGHGYGKANGHEGLPGTLKVLHARKQLEQEIVEQLTLNKISLNNSAFDAEVCKCELKAILTNKKASA